MPIDLQCPACDKSCRVPESLAGRRATCPHCHAVVLIPERPNLPVAAPLEMVDVEPAPEPPVANVFRFDLPDQGERPVGFRCPFCNTSRPPVDASKVSTAGWIFFWTLLLFLCFPLCWLGLLMKDHYRVCRDCGMKLG